MSVSGKYTWEDNYEHGYVSMTLSVFVAKFQPVRIMATCPTSRAQFLLAEFCYVVVPLAMFL